MPRTSRPRVELRVTRFLASALFVTFVAPGLASADVAACLAASEKGQRARGKGRMREAQEAFIVCGAESCPTLVRRDCVQWNSELASTVPTVVFGAKDKQGRDLFNVTVSMDGEVLLRRLDGKSVTVDPGKHTFRFEAAGLPSISESALIKEGERARAIDVTFEGPPSSSSSSSSSSTAGSTSSSSSSSTVTTPRDRTTDRTTGDTKKGDGHTPYPWVMVGIGALGVAIGAVVLVTAPQRPPNCNATTLRCTKTEGMSDADYERSRNEAGTADSQPVLGYLVAGSGLALVAGGLLWHFLEPTTEKSSSQASIRVMPWYATAARSGGGVMLDGKF